MLNTVFGPLLRRLPENNRLERIWKLAQVDFRKRYYNDKLGIVWALINPISQIAIYYFIFKFVFKVDQENYGLFLFGGILIWMFFSEGATGGMHVVRSKKYLIQNIQFNLIDLFTSQALSVLIAFLFNLTAYLVLCWIFGVLFQWKLLLLPILIFTVYIMAMGVGMILSTIQIFLKDITHLWSIAILAGFWSSGIMFDANTAIPNEFQGYLFLHPFVGIPTNLRAITMDVGAWSWTLALVGILWALLFYLSGRFVFTRFVHKALEKM